VAAFCLAPRHHDTHRAVFKSSPAADQAALFVMVRRETVQTVKEAIPDFRFQIPDVVLPDSLE